MNQKTVLFCMLLLLSAFYLSLRLPDKVKARKQRRVISWRITLVALCGWGFSVTTIAPAVVFVFGKYPYVLGLGLLMSEAALTTVALYWLSFIRAKTMNEEERIALVYSAGCAAVLMAGSVVFAPWRYAETFIYLFALALAFLGFGIELFESAAWRLSMTPVPRFLRGERIRAIVVMLLALILSGWFAWM